MPEPFSWLNLPEEWFLLLLRVLFVFLIYFFLYQVFRVQIRELTALASASLRPSATPEGVRLVVVDGGDASQLVGQTYLLQPTNAIGRDPQNTIALDEPFVSSRHAELALVDGVWRLTDYGSTNGTFVNDRPVRGATSVKAGDIVQFGRVKTQFVA